MEETQERMQVVVDAGALATDDSLPSLLDSVVREDKPLFNNFR